MKKILAFVCTVALLFAMAACGNSPADNQSTNNSGNDADAASSGETFKIGTYLQLTGANSIAGNAAKNGIDLAVAAINANGGLNGAIVEVEHYDTQGSTEEAVKIVQRLLTSDIDCVLGSVNSNEVAACLPYLNEAKIYNFGMGTGASWMEDDSMIYTFRASCNNNRTVPQDVAMIQQLGYETIAVINSTDDSAKTTADTFITLCEEENLTITTREQCDQEDSDFSGQITSLLSTDPDVIFMSLQGNTFGPFVKQLRNSGYTGMICSSQTLGSDQLAVAGMSPNTNYIFVAYPYVTYPDVESCTIPNVAEFCQSYLDTFGEMPQHESAYRGWDTMMVVQEAAKIAGSNDDDALREATNQVKIEGLGGQIDFTNGDREAYSSFNGFIKIDDKDLLFDEWLADGGYEAYWEATGREK